ncbi:MAG: GGDEF domain-containing protein [Terracidiphilus sp.]
MKDLIFKLVILPAAVLLGCAATTLAAPPSPLTSLRAIHILSNAEVGIGLPVAFEASVTYYKKGDVDLFVQDGDVAIYVETAPDLNLITGDRVLVTGKMRASFRPEVKSDSVTFLGHGPAPDSVRATFKQLIRADLDCRRATVHAVVRSANIVLDGGLKNLYLQLQMDGGSIDAEMIDSDASNLTKLLDAEVEVTGAVAGKFDSKMQLTGIRLEVPSLSDMKILKLANGVPGSLPVTPMDEILKSYDIQDRTQRVRVQGSITYYQPGSTIVLQSGAKSLLILTQFESPLRIGDVASATGFPDVQNGSLTLTRGEIEDSRVPSPVTPGQLTAEELVSGSHAFDLVSVEGRLLMAIREAAQDQYVLVSGNHLFSAVYRHPERGSDTQLPPMRQVALGSKVRMTGICILDNGEKFVGPVAFDVLLRSSDDVAVVAGPSLLNVRNLVLLVGLLLFVVLAGAARAWLTERRVRHHNARLASVEKRRSHILEDINGSRPVAEIVEEITELVSFKLHGAPCWCDLADGTQLGNRPPDLRGLRVVDSQVHAHSGSTFGTVYAAFHQLTNSDAVESETLQMAAGLAAVAIETRRLYSDLRHRSEFDILTDIHNRFSLDKRLNQLIEEVRSKNGIFGLIYVDLDGFKQINDFYGHQAGDLYLQKVALRMMRQIRPADMLARLGGDEFAVLVPDVRSREDVEEIALRLEQCFDNVFAIDGIQIQGSASLGMAFYPLDGATKDSLLNAADAAMYVAKHAKRPNTAEHRGEANLKVIPGSRKSQMISNG